MTTQAECDLCGQYGPTRTALVEWVVSLGTPYANVDRCTDRAACRERIESRGDTYPVREPLHQREDPK